MGNLVLTIIALTIFSLACVAGIGYIKPSVFFSMIDEYKIKEGIASISASVSEYELVNGEFPSVISDLIDGSYLDNIPTFSKNTSLIEFSSDSESEFYFCFGGDSVKESEFSAYEHLVESGFEGKLLIVSDCDTGEEADAPELFPASLTFRYDYN